MLLVLDSTSRALRAKMSDTPSSVQCSVTVTYADTTATTFVEGMYPIQLNGTTLVTILPAPASGTRRVVKSVMFFNDDTMTHTVTLYLTDNITDYPITKITLPPGSSWASDDQTGVNVGGAVTDGSKGDISVSNGGDTWTIANSAVTLAKMADLTAAKLIGRESSGNGVPQQIGVTGGIEFTGTSIQVGAFSGDVAKTAGNTSLTISSGAVTFAKMQNITSGRLLGRVTSNTGNIEEITPATNMLTFLQTATSANLYAALTSKTGTGGDAVFATRPIFGSTIGVGGATAATSGAGISFPATANYSSDANTLDDYEEGTWTPDVRDGTTNRNATYSARTGKYTRIGNLVFASGGFEISDPKKPGAPYTPGRLFIVGLPFTPTTQANYGEPTFSFFGGQFVDAITANARVQVKSSTEPLRLWLADNVPSSVDYGQLKAGAFCIFSVFYDADVS